MASKEGHIVKSFCHYYLTEDILTWVISVITGKYTSMMTPVASTPAVIHNYSIFNWTGKENVHISK